MTRRLIDNRVVSTDPTEAPAVVNRGVSAGTLQFADDLFADGQICGRKNAMLVSRKT